ATGSAGTSSVVFSVVAGPTAITVGHGGLVFARFSPNASSGAATHTVITFTLPVASVTGTPAADAATSGDCGPASSNGTTFTIECAIGTINPGQVVKRFVTYTAGSTPGDSGIAASVGFDGGSSGAKGGGATNGPSIPAGITIVDGNAADGVCGED